MQKTSENWREMDDEHFWRQCRWEAFRGSGPGGQKRNKTSSAVRVVHEPTGLSAVSSETRSQAENRARAMSRLRGMLAFEIRRPIDAVAFEPPAWWTDLIDAGGKLRITKRHERFLSAGGLTLDVLAAACGSVADAAKMLGISTGNFIKLLETHELLWDHANRIRAARGLKSLKSL